MGRAQTTTNPTLLDYVLYDKDAVVIFPVSDGSKIKDAAATENESTPCCARSAYVCVQAKTEMEKYYPSDTALFVVEFASSIVNCVLLSF